ncbi:Gfo/Idh/MocA family protein [Bacteroidota bacterium]
MTRPEIRFGIIGLGLMGKEFASAAARWCHLLDDGPVPVIKGICDILTEPRKWFTDNFPGIEIITGDYTELLSSKSIDAVYCAVPHNLHEEYYTNIIRAGKHLLGEKPFGIDLGANERILKIVSQHPEVKVRSSSQFAYYPGAKRIIDWIRAKKYGRLMEVRCGFHHSSDMDLNKAINWKRMIDTNGEYGCMGDLGFHTHFIPLRMGWIPEAVYADLQNIAVQRPDNSGDIVPCETWDNAVLTCSCKDPDSSEPFSMVFETKRMAPGATNTWFIEIYGTNASAKYSTHEPKAFYELETKGKEQGWTRTDIGAGSFIPTITGGIFETGFSDALLQMMGAFMFDFRNDGNEHPFPCGTVAETNLSHRLMTAGLESFKQGKRINL